MVASPPRYSKHVLLYNDYKNTQFAFWLYQRLAYVAIPAWLAEVDIMPPAGYTSSLELAAYYANLVVVIGSQELQTSLEQLDQWTLFERKKKLIVLLTPMSTPPEIQAVDFYTSREKGFTSLVDIIKTFDSDYPPIASNGKDFLDAARQLPMFKTRYCLSALQDPDEKIRSQALYELSDHGLSDSGHVIGMMTAALNDPSAEVRSFAQRTIENIASRNLTTLTEITLIEDTNARNELYLGAASWLQTRGETSLNRENHRLKELIDNIQRKAENALPVELRHIFISYTREDAEEFALDLSQRLQKIGFPIWIDTKLEPGSSIWQLELQTAIKQSSVCLFIVSPAMLNSEWVLRECTFAKECNRPILRIKYKETNPMPIYLNAEQGLRPDDPFETHMEPMFEVLVNTLNRMLERRI